MKQHIRISQFALATLAVAAIHGQDFGQTVDFSLPAVTAKSLLEQLSQKTGVTLMTSHQTADEVLLLVSKGAKLSDLMDRIAEAAGAEWQKESAGYRLIRSQALAQKQAREYVQHRANRIKSELDNITKELGRLPEWNAEEARRTAEASSPTAPEISPPRPGGGRERTVVVAPQGRPSAPINRALLRVLAAMNPADLAAIDDGSRVVFAITPTRVQRALSPKAVQAVQQFVAEQTLYAQTSPEPAQRPGGPERVVFSVFDTSPTPLQGGLGEALLIVTRRPHDENLQFELKIADQTGRFVGQAMRYLGLGLQAAGKQPAGSPAAQQKPLELSALGRQHAELLAKAPLGGGRFDIALSGGNLMFRVENAGPGAPPSSAPASVGETWRDKLASADRHEPFGFAISDLFLGWAASSESSLVACLPDGALIPLSLRSLQPMTPSDLERISMSELGLSVRKGGGWTVIGPAYPASIAGTRADRSALGALLRAVGSEGRLSLDVLGRYASTRGQPHPRGIETAYLSLLNQGAYGTFVASLSNWKMVQLWTGLDPVRKKSLMDGAPLALGGLGPQLGPLVNSMVYDDPNGPGRMDAFPPGGRRGPGPIQESVVMAFAESSIQAAMPPVVAGRFGNSLMEERTEFLPNGVPGNGALTLRWQNEDAVYATSGDGDAQGRFFTAQDYGAYLGITSRGGIGGVQLPSYDRFRLGAIRRLRFTFQLPANGIMTRELVDNAVEQGSRPIAFEALPQGFRDSVERARRMMSEAGERGREIRVRGDGQRIPPPPK